MGIEFNQLATVAMLFVLVGVMLGVGVWINNEFANTAFDKSTAVNETVNFAVNDTWYALAYPYVDSVSLVYNNTSTGNVLLSEGTTQGTWQFRAPNEAKVFTNSTVKAGNKYVTYVTWNTTEGVLGAENILISKNATSGQGKLAEWLPIIAVVIAASVVIGVLVTSFSMRREDGY